MSVFHKLSIIRRKTIHVQLWIVEARTMENYEDYIRSMKAVAVVNALVNETAHYSLLIVETKDPPFACFWRKH